MDAQFDGLKKIPPEPAARVLARCNVKLKTPVKAPAAAPVPAVLDELAGGGAWLDLLQLLAAALPPREAVWWACLAARDLTGPVKGKAVPPPLAAAEAWVFQPSDDTRAVAHRAIETVDPDDDTVYCAMAALYAAGTLGPGELSEYPAPPNAVAAMVQTMNMLSAKAHAKIFDAHVQLLIARGLDIARGGNGNVAPEAMAGADAPAAPAGGEGPKETTAPKGAT